ncbi:aminotransferase class IV family protein [Phototrophicus methaneseepsis]|uniref:Aminotransferase class IV family protein n=1 Tax=Phototrophicus methaneseepsis TaxID=2710758 RepID=A0A7S8IFL9_9CHLR|nr:aminotransferase class IV [Phototrophicus methaneseepsis]QPC84870.1 aminotransferase class IV family protein [Phototrophicus methaneseepsis]
MPCYIRRLTPDGLQPVNYEADSLAEAAQYEPDNGVYTVANSFNKTQVLKIDAHLDRLEDSARRANIPLQLDRQHLRSALRQMILEANFGDVRFRVTVSAQSPGTFILSIEPFAPPNTALIEQGVRCITAPNSARESAETKSTHWMHARKALQEAMPSDIYDTFLLDVNGYIMEGLGANFYAIFKDELRTANSGVLQGISRQIVLEVAPAIIHVNAKAVHKTQISRFTEAFLTSSSRGIIPVVEIDGIIIGDGKPGPNTLALRDAYQRWVHTHLEEL